MFTNGKRPDPDELLARVQQQEATAQRGKLRIYLGASAGVGKTFAMLSAAQKEQQEGRPVVIGIVETHGRMETSLLTESIETLPLQSLPYRGHVLAEFDLDGALQRHPALLLVDELAHSNVQGTRHPKRWQDVEELLAAGIDVWSTLNIQHLESLNDVVGQITGIRVLETLPDKILDHADEVILVDLPVDELLARLKAGKVYLPQQAEHAAQNFFRKGNLMALREIALRRTADWVEEDVQTYRVEQSISQVWKTEAAILACVEIDSEHVIRSAARLAGQLNTSWHAVYVETPQRQRLPKNQREHILGSLKLAEQLQAHTALLTGDDVAQSLVDYARQHNLCQIVLAHDSKTRFWSRSLSSRLAQLAPDIDVLQVGSLRSSPSTSQVSKQPRANLEETSNEGKPPSLRYFWAASACLLTTFVAKPLLPFFDLANIVMLFLLTVVLVAVKLGRNPAVLAAFLSVASFDFFFVQPHFSFAVADVQYVLTFLVMLTVGLITGQLTAGLRFQARIAAQRENRARILFEFARDLSGALQIEQVVETSVAIITRAFGGQVALILPDRNERLAAPLPLERYPGLDLGIAQWAFDKGEQAGFATDTLPASEYRFFPLRAPVRLRGVLAIRPERRQSLLIPEHQRQLETFASLIAIALERVHFVEVAQEMLVYMESEHLRNSLLAAISHDLRTPLTALVGLADALHLTHPALTAPQQEIALAIRDSAIRMNTLVNNLLDMARIQSGEIKLKKEWQALEEVIGSAIRSLKSLLGTRNVTVDLPKDLPLVEFDATLIERVFVNVLENAAKYTPPGSPIDISASLHESFLRVSIADRGTGFPAGQEEKIFEKFTRLTQESSTSGVGLGLAICRAIIEAHQGQLWANNRPQGGAILTFQLPARTPPQMEGELLPPMGSSSC